MKTVKIEVVERAEKGTRACRRLRKDGRLPVNLYGLGRALRPLTVSTHEMQMLVDHGQTVVELTLDGKTQAAIMKDLQWDPTGAKLIHADLQRIDAAIPVHVHVPIRYIGTAPAMAGSIVEKQLDSLSLEILPLEIPREVVINLSRVGVGDRVTIGDIELPASAKPFHCHLEDVIVINHIHHEKEETVEEGAEAAEPEVIGKKKDEDA
ncbi:MAG: 50S ribosomal protein L25 [Planctomycetota bacterium]